MEIQTNMEYGNLVYCKRCHRRLRDEEAKQLGYGKICYHKVINQNKNYLFEVPNETIRYI